MQATSYAQKHIYEVVDPYIKWMQGGLENRRWDMSKSYNKKISYRQIRDHYCKLG
jgi:hypothetical protein